ncbi:MAG: hypothetical protein KIG59_05800 [Muribaculaceae bacterium]|nr:hypothetical protein [Muribaculaceae bacterium]
MKKLFLGLLAGVAMLFTACQDEEVKAVVDGDTTVAITAQLPTGVSTRAYADGKTATKLTYAIYETGQITPLITGTANFVNLKTTVNVRLVNGKTYDMLFWAQADGAPYTFEPSTQKVTVNYAAAVGQDEKRDAFFKAETLTVNGTIDKTIQLKRPFAQLNIGATDYAAAETAAFKTTSSAVKVNHVANAINIRTGVATGNKTITFADAAVPADTETFHVTGVDADYLAMNYLLVNDDKQLVDVEFTAKSTKGETITRSYANVPVQRNYRTNIYGNILTEEANFNIVIAPEFETPDYEGVEAATAADLATAVTAGMPIKLTADIALPATLTIPAGKEVTINLNGKKLTNASTQNFAIQVNGTVIIEGDGEVYGGSGHDNQAVHVNVGGKAIIKGGTFNVGGDANGAGNSCVESNGGEIEIYGGVFKSEAQYANKYWVLNMNDRYDCMFKVYGGQFYNFDPSDTNTEPADHSDNFVAPGYKSVKISDDPVIYEVQPE